MKVFVPPHWSRAIDRAAQALRAYAPPDVEIVRQPHEADLVVMHVVGRLDQLKDEIAWTTRQGQSYALVQYALRSTQKPHCAHWAGAWAGAKVVWSYYNLPALLEQDCGNGIELAGKFYHAPLGVYTSTFHDRCRRRIFVACTHGTSWLSEGVREVVVAARTLKRPVFHLGPHVRHADGMVAEVNLSDDAVATRYSECEYVTPLRRIEGFELPAAEGLLCGARPVLFDRPHYRQWFGDWADYIPEGSRPEVEAALTRRLAQPARPVTVEEYIEAARLFNWPRIVKGFWDRCLL